MLKKSLIYLLWIVISLTSLCCKQEGKPIQENIWSSQDRALLVDGLRAVQDSVLLLTQDQSPAQWRFKEDSSRWNIGEVVTHLALHDALFFREIKTLSALPPPQKMSGSLIDEDEYLMEYAIIRSENSGPAPWYLDPKDHWCQKEQALGAYLETRKHFIEFINETEADLRKYYSPNGKGKKPYRDLHQLVLVSIAHGRRHLDQIHSITNHPDYPE